MEDDMDIAVLCAIHIREPCTDPTTGENVRYVYLQEAERILDGIKGVGARSLLQATIDIYSH